MLNIGTMRKKGASWYEKYFLNNQVCYSRPAKCMFFGVSKKLSNHKGAEYGQILATVTCILQGFARVLSLRQEPKDIMVEKIHGYFFCSNIHFRYPGSAKALSQLLCPTPGYSEYFTLAPILFSLATISRDSFTSTTGSALP